MIRDDRLPDEFRFTTLGGRFGKDPKQANLRDLNRIGHVS